MNELWRDGLQACRSSMQKGHRSISVVIVLIVAFGIGTATSVFSIIDAVLIRDFPFPAAGELVSVELATAREHGRSLFGHVATLALYEAWRREAGDAIELAGFQEATATLLGDWSARNLQTVGITSNAIAMLRVQPLHGRIFVSTDDVRGAAPSAILSYGLWTQLFGGDPAAIGRPLTLNGRHFQIVGIMPRGFHIPLSIPEAQQMDPELWIPISGLQELFPSAPGPEMPLEVIGRVRPGGSITSIERRLDSVAKEVIDAKAGRDTAIVAQVNRISELRGRSIRTPLFLVSAAVVLLLFLTCLNVANLLMARTIARDREIAVKVALGISRSRLALQFITEGVALSLFGGVLGVALAFVAMPWLVDLCASYLPEVDTIAINFRVLVSSLGAALASGIAVSAWPAAAALNRSPIEALVSRMPARTSAARRWMRALVVLEIAFAVVVLTTMGLLTRSFVRLEQAARGYDVRNVIVAGLVLPERLYSTLDARRTFTLRLLDELRHDPSITFPAVSSGVPMIGGTMGTARDGDGPPNATGARVAIWSFAGDYFRSLGIRVIRGNGPDSTGTSIGVAIDAAAASVLFGTEDAVGRRIVWGRANNEGVVNALVGNIQDLSVNLGTNSRLRNSVPHIYVPTAHDVSPVIRVSVRSRGNPVGALDAVRQAIATIDRSLAIDPLDTMEGLVRANLARERFLMEIIALFASLSFTLGSVGIFAVMAHSTAQRTHEIGVRLALGARPSGIVLLILSDALRMTAAGVAMGVLFAFALGGIIRSLLFETSAFDTVTVIGVVLLITAVSLLASGLPALRAARVNATVRLLGGQ